MQFLIDTQTDNVWQLVAAARSLLMLANVDMAEDEQLEVVQANRHAPKPAPIPAIQPVVIPKAPPVVAPIPLPPGNVPPAPVVHPEFHPDSAPEVPTGTQLDLDPAAIFAGNVVPLVNAATAQVAATGSAPPILAPAIAPPPVPGALNAAAPAAEASTATTPTSATAGVPASVAGDLDKAGIPWDARVHSETRKVNADGTWRFRRNLDEAVKIHVMAELQLQARSPGSAVTLPPVNTGEFVGVIAAPPPPLDVAPPPPVSLPVTGTAPVPLPASADVGVSNAAGPVVVQSAAPVTSFRDLMNKVNQALAAGRITQPQLVEACKAAGADGVSSLASQPLLVPAVDAYLNRWLVAA